jgi:hypothetical protein
LIVAEVRVPGTGGNNQIVVRILFVGCSRDFCGQIDCLNVSHQNFNILGILQNVPDRLSNIARRQACSGNLVEQRLKQVMVSPIDKVTAARWLAKAFAAYSPPNPPPMITTFGTEFCMRLLEIVKLFTNGPKAQGEFRFRVPGFEFPGFESGFRAVAAKRKRPKVGVVAKGKERRPPIGL